MLEMKNIPNELWAQYDQPFLGHHVMYASNSAIVSRTFSAAAAVDSSLGGGRNNHYPNLVSCMADAIAANLADSNISSSMSCSSQSGNMSIALDCATYEFEYFYNPQSHKGTYKEEFPSCKFDVLYNLELN